MWLGWQLASIQPAYLRRRRRRRHARECVGYPWTRALPRTHRCELAGLPVSASAWMPPRSRLASFVLHVTGSRGCSPKAGASAFGLLSARIPSPGRSNNVARPPLPKRPGLPGVYLFSAALVHGVPVGAPLHTVFPPFPSVRFSDALAGRRGWFEWQNRTGRQASRRTSQGASEAFSDAQVPRQVVNGMQPPYQAGVGSVVSTHGASSSKVSHWMGWHLTA
jgi:hypothetical protein